MLSRLCVYVATARSSEEMRGTPEARSAYLPTGGVALRAVTPPDLSSHVAVVVLVLLSGQERFKVSRPIETLGNIRRF